MTPNVLLAAAIHSRHAFDDVAASGEPDHFPEDLQPIWGQLEAYYARDPDATRADRDLLAEAVSSSEASPKRRALARETVMEVASADVSIENVRAACTEARRLRLGERLAIALATRRAKDEIAALIEEYASVEEPAVEEVDPEAEWTSLLEVRAAEPQGYAVAPRVLGEKVAGGLRPGHSVLVFGRPNSGKSALAITMASAFARRKLRVLYLGNEDPIEDLRLRAVQAIAQVSSAELLEDPAGVARKALRRGLGHMLFRDICPGSAREVESLAKATRPHILVVDQLRNLTAKSENTTQRLDAVAQAMRAVAKKHKLVHIGVTQAGDSAEGKPVLNMGDVDSSNTGIPGATDLMIGVGLNDGMKASGQRMLTICKSKIGGWEGHFLVRLDPVTLRIMSP